MQDHIKRAVLDAIIDEIAAAESPSESNDDSDPSEEADGGGHGPAASTPPINMQARPSSIVTFVGTDLPVHGAF